MRMLGVVTCLMISTTIGRAAEPDLLIADFEGDSYGEWTVTGEAFGPGPAKGTLPGQMHVEGFEGKGLVNSFFKGDGTTGTLTSPEFTIQRKFLCFLIGGGKHDLAVNLMVEGKTARTAAGPNDKPGGTERLEWHSWDVTDLAGKKARLQILDNATGGWGHINVDHVLQSETHRGLNVMRRELPIAANYLHIPVKNKAAKRPVKFIVDGRIVRDVEIELAEATSPTNRTPDFIAFQDVRAFRGKTLVVETLLPHESKTLEGITQSDELPAATDSERERPRFHFTSRRGWLNDPNGLVYAHGEWHLYYQHNPYGWDWGNMHWGHAVSTDLLNWTELPTAIYPRKWGDWAFSGSAVVDARNTSGFKTGDDAVLVAAYTSTGRGECIVFSNDRGRTWTEFEGNPVVKHAGRDPKLIWHEPASRWVMAVYDETPKLEKAIAFYSSPNLKEWTFTGRIEGFYECPDLFALPVDGDKAQPKWVLYAADGKYMIGNFDGKTFTKEADKRQVWFGNFYAAQTFDNAPEGRRVQIGWANGVAFPGQPFNQQMTIPVELTLRTTVHGVRMFAWPVKEVDRQSRGVGFATLLPVDHLRLVPGTETAFTHPLPHNLLDVTVTIEPKQAEKVTLTVCGAPVVYDAKAGTLTCRHVSAPVALTEGKLALRVLSDNGSLEVFVNGGEAALSIANKPSATDRSVKALATGGEAVLWRPNVANLNPPE